MKTSKTREELVNFILGSLEAETIPWHMDWVTELPINATTGRRYHGINMFYLSLVAMMKGYKDPRWVTFNQAKEKGWSVKKGSESVPLEFWTLYDKKEKKNLSYHEAEMLLAEIGSEEYKTRVYALLKTFKVFNGSQIDGIPEFESVKKEKMPEELTDIRDRIIKGLGVGFLEGGNSAAYYPRKDLIVLPPIEQFKTNEGYMSTFLHESAHATGHSSRLDRDLSSSGNLFEFNESYAIEELRAEISSAIMSMILGIENPEMEYKDNHRAYIQSWVSHIKEKKETLFNAIKDAETISDYIIKSAGLEKDLSTFINPDIENEEKQETLPEPQDITYEIYQIGEGSVLRDRKFDGYDRFGDKKDLIKADAYDFIYKSKLDRFDGPPTLEMIYEEQNTNHPENYRGHSLSVSDVILIRQGKKSEAYFVDSFGFQTINDFEKVQETTRQMRTPASSRKKRKKR